MLPTYLKQSNLFLFCAQKVHRDRFHLKIYSIHCVPEEIDSVLQLKNPASQKKPTGSGKGYCMQWEQITQSPKDQHMV